MVQNVLCGSGERCVAHVAGFVEGVVECEGAFEHVRCLAAASDFEIVVEQFAVHGVSAVVDNLVGALNGVFSAEVGDALVGDEDVDRVFGVVGVGHHGHDVGDEAAFGYRRAGEDGDVGVAGERSEEHTSELQSQR